MRERVHHHWRPDLCTNPHPCPPSARPRAVNLQRHSHRFVDGELLVPTALPLAPWVPGQSLLLRLPGNRHLHWMPRRTPARLALQPGYRRWVSRVTEVILVKNMQHHRSLRCRLSKVLNEMVMIIFLNKWFQRPASLHQGSDVNTQLLIICCMLLTNHSRVYSVTSLTSQRIISSIMTRWQVILIWSKIEKVCNDDILI